MINISQIITSIQFVAATDQKQQIAQIPDWKREKEIWKQIIDRYHKGTRRIPSPA